MILELLVGGVPWVKSKKIVGKKIGAKGGWGGGQYISKANAATKTVPTKV